MNYSPKTLAKEWDVSDDVIYKLIREKKLGCFRVGALIRITQEDVDNYQKDNRECQELNNRHLTQFLGAEENQEYGKSNGLTQNQEQLKSYLQGRRMNARLNSL